MQRLKAALKKNIAAGLLIMLPACLTFFLLAFVISGTDEALAPVVSELIRFSGIPLPHDFHLPGLGFMIIFLLIFLVGLSATNFVGRRVVAAGDFILNKTPFVRMIYISVKKIMETLSQSQTVSFKKVAIIDYPRPGMKVMGVVCCDTQGEVQSCFREDMINVLIPTAPNPASGFLVMAPRKSVIPLDMPVNDGIKILVSLGTFDMKGKGGSQDRSTQPI
ncbi:MAG: DUF502 domain-containing protein [Nitrospinales bacterium]